MTAMPTSPPSVPDPDRPLFEAFRDRGDQAALERMLQGMLPAAMTVAARRLAIRSDAEDAVQAAFAAAVANCRRWRPGSGTVRGWLMTIVINECRMRNRGDERRRRREGQAQAPVSSPMPDPDLAEALALALQELPDRERIAIELRYLSGLEFAEVATTTGRPEKTIRDQVSRGLERMRRILSRLCGGPVEAGAVLALLLQPAEAPSAELADAVHGMAQRATPPPAAGVASTLMVAGAVVAAGLAIAAWWWPMRQPQPLPPAAAAADPPPRADILDRVVSLRLLHERVGEAIGIIRAELGPDAPEILVASALVPVGRRFPEPWWGISWQGAAPLRQVLDACAAQSGMRWLRRDGLIVLAGTMPAEERAALVARIAALPEDGPLPEDDPRWAVACCDPDAWRSLVLLALEPGHPQRSARLLLALFNRQEASSLVVGSHPLARWWQDDRGLTEAVRRCLADPPGGDLRAGLCLAGHLSDPGLGSALIARFESDAGGGQQQSACLAMEALARRGGPAAGPVVATLAERILAWEPDGGFQVWCAPRTLAHALVRCDAGQARETFIRCLARARPAAGRDMLQALTAGGPPWSRDLLVDLVRKRGEGWGFLEALARMGDPRAAALARERLADPAASEIDLGTAFTALGCISGAGIEVLTWLQARPDLRLSPLLTAKVAAALTGSQDAGMVQRLAELAAPGAWRELALSVLAGRREPAAMDALLQAWAGAAASERPGLALLLVSSRDDRGAAAVLQALIDRSLGIADLAAADPGHRLAGSRSPQWVDGLLGLIPAAGDGYRDLLAMIPEHMDDSGRVGRLAAMTGDPTLPARMRSELMLRMARGPLAWQEAGRGPMRKLLVDPQPYLRASAVHLLEQRRDTDCEEALLSLLRSDPDPQVRTYAAITAGRWDLSSAALLTALRDDPQPQVRRTAAICLGRYVALDPGRGPEMVQALGAALTAERAPEVRSAIEAAQSGKGGPVGDPPEKPAPASSDRHPGAWMMEISPPRLRDGEAAGTSGSG